MQDSREIDYFGQRILQIIQPLAAGEDRQEVLTLLAQSVANNFAADGCWVLHYPEPGSIRVAASGCVSHRTNSISTKIPSYTPPPAPTPSLWRMPLLPDYQVMVVEIRDRGRVNGCLMVATKGVEWYRETKLVLQIVADYIGTALIEQELQFQAQISEIYPKLHYQLSQAIVENQKTDRLFEIAVSDMVDALKLKRGLVLKLKTSDPSKQKQSAVKVTDLSPTDALQLETEDVWAEQTDEPAPISAIDPARALASQSTQVQIVTTIDTRNTIAQKLPSFFLLESSQFCREALANVPNPTIFNGSTRGTPIDRLIFQDDRLPSIAMIPLMGSTIPDRHPQQSVWGWLVLQHHENRRWHPVELKLLQCQIYQIVLARIHTKSLQQAHSKVDNRTSQVQILLQIQTKLLADARNQMEKLKQANELKDEFINTIGHELRTPLTSMSLAIKMLQQAEIEPERRQQYLNILDEQCQREIKLVNDLLKMQQVESHQLDFRPQSIAIDRFIAEQATFVSERWLDSKSLTLSLHLPNVPHQIDTDAESLKHIVEELLINAGKFASPNTEIAVWVSVEGRLMTIEVTNISKPIADEDLPHLFDKFRRGQGTTKQAIAGTGLGLALVKSLVEHIKGEISLTSTPIDETMAKICFIVKIPTVLERH
jgi:signal transduction histidine kinase